MPYYYWWDPTYFLVIIGAVICLLASAHVNNTFKKLLKFRVFYSIGISHFIRFNVLLVRFKLKCHV